MDSSNLYSEAESFDSRIQETIHYIPPLPDTDGCDTLSNLPFLPFHGRHLSDALSLKSVRIVPSLTEDIASVFHKELEKFRAEMPELPPVDRASGFPGLAPPDPPSCDAVSVAGSYLRVEGGFGPCIASSFLLHRNALPWSTALDWAGREALNTLSCDAFYEDSVNVITLHDRELLSASAWKLMDPEVAQLLQNIVEKDPKISVWHVFSPTPEALELLRNIDSLGSSQDFPIIRSKTCGLSPDEPPPRTCPDALETAWGTQMSSFISSAPTSHATQRRSARLQKAVSKGTGLQPTTKVTRPTKRNTNHAPTRVSLPPEKEWLGPGCTLAATTASIIQHIWYRAVELDGTFVIILSGLSQRIGMRHRATQTLYLSEEIPFEKAEDPPYGAIQIGLFFMSMIIDVLDRAKQQLARKPSKQAEGKAENSVSSGKSKKGRRKTAVVGSREKAKATQDPPERMPSSSDRVKRRKVPARSVLRARPRTRNFEARESARRRTTQAFVEGDRPLLLVRFQEEHLQSPTPSSFLRAGIDIGSQSVFEPNEYMILTLTSRIGTGATGEVHRAIITAPGDEALQCEVVVKLGLKADQRERIRHEFDIYCHLKASGVRPIVFGMFQDLETRTSALVMENAGESVWHQRYGRMRNSTTVKFSEEEKKGFIKIMNEIHDAGVRHRDIRIMNMMINEAGEPVIIDFDRALRGASEASRRKELEHLKDTLAGDTSEPGYLATLSSQETPPFPTSA